MVVLSVTVGQETGGKHYNGIHSVAIVALIKWKEEEKNMKNYTLKNQLDGDDFFGRKLDCSRFSLFCVWFICHSTFPLCVCLCTVSSQYVSNKCNLFYSTAHSSSDLLSLRQRLFSGDDRAADVDFPADFSCEPAETSRGLVEDERFSSTVMYGQCFVETFHLCPVPKVSRPMGI